MNLEKLFEKALRAYFAAHRVSRDGLEDAVADAYADWSDKPLDELDGKTPREYVAAVTDPAEIAEGALAGVRNGGEPSPLFADRVAEVPAASARLTEVLESDEPERVRVAAAELLHRAGAVPVETYIDLVFDPDTPDNLRETLIEQLEYTDGAAGPLLARLGEAEGENRKILAELLVACGARGEKVYGLLEELVREPGNAAYASQLIARYGDERALPLLAELSAKCDYADYIELRNAAEMLGGDVPLRFDWSGDATYKKIKGE